jgi:hypothetical protein
MLKSHKLNDSHSIILGVECKNKSYFGSYVFHTRSRERRSDKPPTGDCQSRIKKKVRGNEAQDILTTNPAAASTLPAGMVGTKIGRDSY